MNRISPKIGSSPSTYDAAGNRLTSTDARGNTTSFVYDTLNRLIEVSDPEPFADQKQIFVYDDVGNQRFVTNRRGHTTENVYDVLNRLTEVIDPPLSGSGDIQNRVLMSYDAAGNRLTETDRRGIPLDLQLRRRQPTGRVHPRRITARNAGIRCRWQPLHPDRRQEL